MTKRMSRENQKLIYWFFDCYAYYQNGIDINFRYSSQKPPLSAYSRYEAKEYIKKLYIKHSGLNFKNYEPFKNIESKLKSKLGDIIDKNYTRDVKINVISDILIDFVREEIQKLLLTLTGTFSLSLHMMSNEGAIAFTNYLFDYFLQNDIPMWEEMQLLFKEQNEEKYIYSKLKHKKCAVCNKSPVDLHHWKSAASLGGYKHDKGQGEYISLCRDHHSEFHNIGVEKFAKKYDVKPVKLGVEQVKELKKIYKGHFKAFKE